MYNLFSNGLDINVSEINIIINGFNINIQNRTKNCSIYENFTVKKINYEMLE